MTKQPLPQSLSEAHARALHQLALARALVEAAIELLGDGDDNLRVRAAVQLLRRTVVD